MLYVGVLVFCNCIQAASPCPPFFAIRATCVLAQPQVQKTYTVRISEPFVLAITSCASPDVRPGANKLEDIGGSGKIQTKEFSVRCSIVWVAPKNKSFHYRHAPCRYLDDSYAPGHPLEGNYLQWGLVGSCCRRVTVMSSVNPSFSVPLKTCFEHKHFENAPVLLSVDLMQATTTVEFVFFEAARAPAQKNVRRQR